MSEQISIPEHRFASKRDEALFTLANAGWANDSCGDLTSETGWFARISNSHQELAEVAQAFDDELQHLGVAVGWLEGHFLVSELPEGEVTVAEYQTQDELVQVFERRQAAYWEWTQP